MWQILIVGITFMEFHIVRDPWVYLYVKNNVDRTYKVAMVKEKAHKKKLQEAKEKEEAEEAKAAGGDTAAA
jgi:hypothetical protein